VRSAGATEPGTPSPKKNASLSCSLNDQVFCS
jgi:hypothetical protein